MTPPFDSEHDVGIELDSPAACEMELQRCSNGMAQLTQEFTRNAEARSEVKDQYERVEAIVAKTIREGSDAKLTATEVRARLTELITEDAELAHFREAMFALEAEKESLERRLRTLEKRGGHAQSALNKHHEEARLISSGYGEAGR